MNTTLNNLNVVQKNNEFYVDSREVARITEKRHSDLVRSISNYESVILTDAKLRSLDFFLESHYKDKKGELRKNYLLTKKGCDMVANKMTGNKGISFTATYVDAFHRMKEHIQGKLVAKDSYMIDDPVERAKVWIKEQEKTLLLEQEVGELKPKADYVDEILKSPGTVAITQIAADYGMTAQKLNKILHEAKLQHKVNKQWILYKAHMKKGYTKSETISFIRNDGVHDTKIQTKWTQKGRLKINEILNGLGYEAQLNI